jgi:hypothetical protein
LQKGLFWNVDVEGADCVGVVCGGGGVPVEGVVSDQPDNGKQWVYFHDLLSLGFSMLCRLTTCCGILYRSPITAAPGAEGINEKMLHIQSWAISEH